MPSNFSTDSAGQYKAGHTGTIEVQAKVERGVAINFLGQPHDGTAYNSNGAVQFLGLAMEAAGYFDAATGDFTPQLVAWCRTGSFPALCAVSFAPGDYVWSNAQGEAMQGTVSQHYGQAYSYGQAGGMVEVLLGKALVGV